MSDFRQTFLTDAINKLTALETELEKDFSENLRREAFRMVHTIKGGAQTFDLPRAAKIADQLENSLSVGANTANDKNQVAEGIEILINSLRTDESPAPADFLEKPPVAGRKPFVNKILFINIPLEAFKNLSAQERAAAVSAIGAGKDIFSVEVGFEAAKFVEDYRKLQQVLSETSEILASLPSEKYKLAGKIGFRIFIASRETLKDLQSSLEDFDAEIRGFEQNDSSGLAEMLRRIVAHGASIAEKSGKEIRFTIFSNGAPSVGDKVTDFFEILLHLVRNAADHAIEKSGTVEIVFFDENERVYLSVADDGRGIDLRKVRARAVAKNLISDDDVLNEQEIFALVFAPELSTAERLTEISGRGVGLDAVKRAVEKINGKISARNRKSKGAIFEIVVPK